MASSLKLTAFASARATPGAGFGMSNASTRRVSKPVRPVCSVTSVPTSIAAPASSTNENAICVVAKIRRRRFVAGVIRTLPLPRPRPSRRATSGRRGTNASSTAAPSRERRHPDEPRIRRSHRAPERRSAPHTRDMSVTSGSAIYRPSDGAGGAEHQAFGEQRAPQRRVAGAERGAQRQLALAPHRPRQNQVRDVGARDDEDDAPPRRAGRAGSFVPAPRSDRGASRRGAAGSRASNNPRGCSRIIARVQRRQLGARRRRSTRRL